MEAKTNFNEIRDGNQVAEENIKEKYKSSKLILDYVYKEYSRENERRKNIESRITILITILTFFAGLILANNQIGFQKMLQNGDKNIYTFVTIEVLSCLSLLGSMGIFVSILVAREYKTIKLDNFINIKPQGADEGLVAYDLIKAYKECFDFNKKVNDFKFKMSNMGIGLLVISVALYLVLRILSIYN